MNSLHARRPPKLEQGERLRHSKRAAGLVPTIGGGALRRPPNVVGIDPAIDAADVKVTTPGGEPGKEGFIKKPCGVRRQMISVFVAIFFAYLFVRKWSVFLGLNSGESMAANDFGLGKGNNDGPSQNFLRAKRGNDVKTQ